MSKPFVGAPVQSVRSQENPPRSPFSKGGGRGGFYPGGASLLYRDDPRRRPVAAFDLERQGDDLFCEIPIKFTYAALGGTIEVPTLSGKASLKIPPATQSGTTFRLRGKGMPSLRGGTSGDQMVRVHVEVPASLSGEQRRILEEFARVRGDANEPTSRSFFEKAKKFF